MRSHPLRLLAVALALVALALTHAARAQRAGPPVPTLVIDDPGVLRAGSTRELTLRLQPAPGQDHPVLLTPRVEGVAVTLARGRLLRADARATERSGELRFALPVQVREPGTAIVRVEALTHRCETRCVAVRVRAERTLVVQ